MKRHLIGAVLLAVAVPMAACGFGGTVIADGRAGFTHRGISQEHRGKVWLRYEEDSGSADVGRAVDSKDYLADADEVPEQSKPGDRLDCRVVVEQEPMSNAFRDPEITDCRKAG